MQWREQRQAPTQSQLTPKRSKSADSRTGGQQSRTCGKCGKCHFGVCRAGSGCHRCGKEGYYAKDCHQAAPVPTMRICYHCDHVGHLKTSCLLLASKPTQVSTPATLMIADGRPVNEEPPKAQARTFQHIAEEARAAPDVVAGTFISFISFIIFVLCLSIVLVIRYVFSELLACIGFI